MWQEVIGSDRASDEVTMAYTARVNPQAAADPAENPARYHSLDFLTNAYLQLGQDQQAKRIVDARNSVAEYPASFRYSGHTAFAAIPVRYAFERAAWAEARRLPFRRHRLRKPRRSPGSAARSALPAAAIRRRPRTRSSNCAPQGQARQGERRLLGRSGCHPGAGRRGLDRARRGPQSRGHRGDAPSRRPRRSERQACRDGKSPLADAGIARRAAARSE